MGDVQGDIAKDMRARGMDPYGLACRVSFNQEPPPERDVREHAARFRHALEVIRDAEGLDASALRAIALAVVGPGRGS